MVEKIDLSGWGLDNRVNIMLGLVVDKNISYEQRAELLLNNAIKEGCGKRSEGYGDDKQLVGPEGIASLMGAGAHVIELNKIMFSGHYINQVIYKEHRFIAVTEEPYIFII